MNSRAALSAIVGSTFLLGASAGLAQQAQQRTDPPRAQMNKSDAPGSAAGRQAGAQDRSAAATQCRQGLQDFAERMDREGYWLTGWGSRWNYGYGTRPGVSGAAPPPATSTPPADRRMAAGDAAGREPWAGARWGMTSPRYQLGTLQAAANVLAYRGDQEACQAVLAEMQQLYGGYVEELKQAGVDPNEVTSWRQARLVAAQPVEQLDLRYLTIGDVIGTEMRNLRDEELGEIEDVIVDPKSGGIRYVVLESGGFLGIGEQMVPIPWSVLKATPGLNTFVLNVSGDLIEQAPSVDPARLADARQSAQIRTEIENFWQNRVKD
ncbi:PRC-barrel domain-containing protein [Desertibaculum subflavum]|uniref:PRC-barrel domain-containing protein n=1 Tax=Desertibaculum subflavum TaxID=2268458 RepID=UPI0013C4F003